MAEIVKTSLSGSGSREMVITTLGSSDTFIYQVGDIMIVDNVSGGAITPNLDGDGSTTIPVAGYGEIDVSGGYDVPSIANGEKAVIPLDTISSYLKGTVTVTAGDGAKVSIIRY